MERSNSQKSCGARQSPPRVEDAETIHSSSSSRAVGCVTGGTARAMSPCTGGKHRAAEVTLQSNVHICLSWWLEHPVVSPGPSEGTRAAVPPPTLCSIYLFTGAQLPKAPWKIPALICTKRLVCSRLSSEKSTSISPRLSPPPRLFT